MNVVILSNILFQVDDKKSTIDEAKRVLAPNGKLVIIDWTHSFGGLGPQDKDVVSKGDAIALASTADFALAKEFDAGDHHYGLIFVKR